MIVGLAARVGGGLSQVVLFIKGDLGSKAFSLVIDHWS
jgi:hypothetical protein